MADIDFEFRMIPGGSLAPGEFTIEAIKTGGEGTCDLGLLWRGKNYMWPHTKNLFQRKVRAEDEEAGRAWNRCLCVKPLLSLCGDMARPYKIGITFPEDFCAGLESYNFLAGRTFEVGYEYFSPDNPTFACSFEFYISDDLNIYSGDAPIPLPAWQVYVVYGVDFYGFLVAEIHLMNLTLEHGVLKYYSLASYTSGDEFPVTEESSSDPEKNPAFTQLTVQEVYSTDECGPSGPIIIYPI